VGVGGRLTCNCQGNSFVIHHRGKDNDVNGWEFCIALTFEGWFVLSPLSWGWGGGSDAWEIALAPEGNY
jgi:hypothetical protein